MFEQYQIDNSSYHGTLEYKVWKLHVDQETPVYAFGTMLWTVMGAFVGVSVNSGALQSGRLMPVVLGLLAGTGIGAAVGFAISFATINGYKLGWVSFLEWGGWGAVLVGGWVCSDVRRLTYLTVFRRHFSGDGGEAYGQAPVGPDLSISPLPLPLPCVCACTHLHPPTCLDRCALGASTATVCVCVGGGWRYRTC